MVHLTAVQPGFVGNSVLDNWLIDIAFIGVTLSILFGLEYITGRKMFGRAERVQLAFDEVTQGFGRTSIVLLGITVLAGCAAVLFWYI